MLQLTVNYKLREYLQLANHFRPQSPGNRAVLKRTAGSIWVKAPWLETLLVYLVAPPVFFYKKHRVGQCIFQFDEIGLRRISKNGTLNINWAEVWGVHSLPGTFVIELDKGALPLPLTCLSSEQHDVLVGFIPPNKLLPVQPGGAHEA